jgi:hypothetical protein
MRSTAQQKYLTLVKPSMTVRNDRRKETLQTLMSAGLLQPVKRGRPQIYENDEERLAALKLQKQVCSHRYTERVKAARMLLKENMRSTDDVNNVRTM